MTTIRNGNLFCANCGGEYRMQYPMPVSESAKKMKAFDELHQDCEKTWVEPSADQSAGVKEKAMWWIANGETGLSSKTMWRCFMGQKDERICHPSDPDDFKRCYKLLRAVPEWKKEMRKLVGLSDVWRQLVDNWDKLTEMYEENERTDWKECKRIGMYEFMKKLGA